MLKQLLIALFIFSCFTIKAQQITHLLISSTSINSLMLTSSVGEVRTYQKTTASGLVSEGFLQPTVYAKTIFIVSTADTVCSGTEVKLSTNTNQIFGWEMESIYKKDSVFYLTATEPQLVTLHIDSVKK
jgi:hypothetical protein